MMIERAAERIALAIKQANAEETASVAVMKFALILLINLVVAVAGALAVGAATGKFWDTFLSLVWFAALRTIGGGYHFHSNYLCIVATIAIVAVPPHVRLPESVVLALTVTSVCLAWWLAPSHLRGYNRISESVYPWLRLIVIAWISMNLWLQSSAFSLLSFIHVLSNFEWKGGKGA